MVYCDESEYRVWVILKRAVALVLFTSLTAIALIATIVMYFFIPKIRRLADI